MLVKPALIVRHRSSTRALTLLPLADPISDDKPDIEGTWSESGLRLLDKNGSTYVTTSFRKEGRYGPAGLESTQ